MAVKCFFKNDRLQLEGAVGEFTSRYPTENDNTVTLCYKLCYTAMAVANCGFGGLSYIKLVLDTPCCAIKHPLNSGVNVDEWSGSQVRLRDLVAWCSYGVKYPHLNDADLISLLDCAFRVNNLNAAHFLSDSIRANNTSPTEPPYTRTCEWVQLIARNGYGKLHTLPVAWSNPNHVNSDHSIIQMWMWTPPHMEKHLIAVPKVKSLEHVIQTPTQYMKTTKFSGSTENTGGIVESFYAGLTKD